MPKARFARLTREILLRTCADIVMVNAALFLSLSLRYLWLVGLEDSALPRQKLLHYYLQMYASSAWLITIISIAMFFGCGFYTHGRAYRGRYKALAVVQAVTLSYLLFGFIAYLLSSLLNFPRAAIVLAWLLTMAFLGLARVWAALWVKVVKAEARLFPVAATDRKIQTILVIGGDGYLGSALLPKLLAKGYYVRVLSLFLYGPEPIQALLNHPRLQTIKADFRQVDKVVEAMRDVDAVVHLGAIVGDPACALDEELTIDVNVMATRMIAEVAKGHGVNRFIFASTCSVYGASDEILDENSALTPVSLYARSKIACERILTIMEDDSFAPVCLRFGTIFGLSGRTRFDLVVNLLTAKAVVDGEITVTGGDQWRPFVHVDDVARAVLKVLEAPLALVRNEVFNVGSNEQNYTISQIAELIHRAVPGSHLVDRGADGDRRNYQVNFTKIRSLLDFRPVWTVEQGIQEVILALQLGKVRDYRDPKHSNVRFLSEEGFARLVHRQNDWVHEFMSEGASATAASVGTSTTRVSVDGSEAMPGLLVTVGAGDG